MDGQMRKLTAAFRYFANAPKNGSNDMRYGEHNGTRYTSRYKHTACLDRNSVQ